VSAHTGTLIQPFINDARIVIGALSSDGHCLSNECAHTGAQENFRGAAKEFICVLGTRGEAGSCIELAFEHSLSEGVDDVSRCQIGLLSMLHQPIHS